MRFAFTKEEDDFRQEVREFLKNELPKNWDGVAGNNQEKFNGARGIQSPNQDLIWHHYKQEQLKMEMIL